MRILTDKELMRHCLELAKQGSGRISPNPMVGCVIVQGKRIVGEGFHKQFGGAHAEIYALLQAKEKAKDAALYVNLEPCVHFGKTPPCVDAIIQSGISKVITATEDPNPLVSGKGISRLREAGIHVRTGLLQKEAEILNEKFFKYMKTDLPYVGVKLAQTLDARITDIKGKSKWITSELARKEVHRLRAEYDAILIGAKSVRKDNPELTVRAVKGRNPIRIVIDGRLSLPISRKIFNTSDAPTWVLTTSNAFKVNRRKVLLLASQGVRVFDMGTLLKIKEKTVLQTLSQEGISSVLIEGGTQTISGFINQSLVDKMHLFIAPKILGGGLEAFKFNAPRSLANSIHLKDMNISLIGADILIEAKFKWQ
jgi:diaminohydroxyphosphoribosylaminopyrimidine deaminase / 5-amino-6-(5-phosphoribosylamino)uracil reductase